MLVSLCPEPVFYICSLVPTNSTMNLEPRASSPTHQNNPTANEEKTQLGKERKKERAKLKRDMQIKLQPKITFRLTVPRNVKPLMLSANVQDEVQTIHLISIYF